MSGFLLKTFGLILFLLPTVFGQQTPTPDQAITPFENLLYNLRASRDKLHADRILDEGRSGPTLGRPLTRDDFNYMMNPSSLQNLPPHAAAAILGRFYGVRDLSVDSANALQRELRIGLFDYFPHLLPAVLLGQWGSIYWRALDSDAGTKPEYVALAMILSVSLIDFVATLPPYNAVNRIWRSTGLEINRESLDSMRA